MRIGTVLIGLFISCLEGLIWGDLLQPISTSITPVTKFDERNSDGWRETCRSFSQGDPMTGEFTTPNYPNHYPANVECVRVIHAPVDYTILLDFRGTFFEVERSNDIHKSRLSSLAGIERPFGLDQVHCPFDYLEVRNGAYGFSPLIGRFCGDRFPPVIAAESGSMWLLFKTDHTIQYRGFRAVHYAAPKLASPDITKYRSHICSFASIISDDSNISLGTDEIRKVHPDLFANRSHNSPIECVWKVETPSKAHKLRLHFDIFDLNFPNECNMNSIEVYAHTTSRSHLVKQFCGRIANYVDTSSYLAYVRIFLTESSFAKTTIKASFVPYAAGKDCNGSMFSCGDETCIPRALVCNGRADCLSNLDERKCGKGDRPLLNFFNSPYLVILIIIVILIVSILSCAVVVNVWHRVKKRRILYAPVKRSESSRGILGNTPPMDGPNARTGPRKRSASVDPSCPLYHHMVAPPEALKPMNGNGPLELMYSTHVPVPSHLLPPSETNSRLCELLPSDPLPLYMCPRGYYVDVDTLRVGSTAENKAVQPFNSPFWNRRPHALPPIPARSPGSCLSANTGTLSSQLWAATPSTTRIHPSTAADSTVAYCSSQSTASGSVDKKARLDNDTCKRSKRKLYSRANKKHSKMAASKDCYQTRSSSSSRHDALSVPTHKFWARMEDLITTTEDSSDAAEGQRKGSLGFEDNVANLSDLTNRQSSSEETTEESDQENVDRGEEWLLNEADSILESEALRLEGDDEDTELILTV